MLVHHLVDGFAQPRWYETALVLIDVTAILDGTDNWHVGAWPSNALLFEFFDQTRLCIAWGRLSKVLLWLETMQIQHFIHLHDRQQFLVLLAGPDGIEAGELEVRAGSTEDILPGSDVYTHGIKHRRSHKACHKATPDEVIQFELIGCQMRLDNLRSQCDIRRANCFVRILGSGLGLPCPSGADVGLTEFLRDIVFDLTLCIFRDACRVCAHIGDEALMPTCSQFDALVELL